MADIEDSPIQETSEPAYSPIAISFADKIRSIEKFEVNNATFMDFIRAVKSTIEALDLAVMDKDDMAQQAIEYAKKIENKIVEKKMTDSIQYKCAIGFKQAINHYRAKIVYLENIIRALDHFLNKSEEIVLNNMGINGENIRLQSEIKFMMEKLEEREKTWIQRLADKEEFWKERIDSFKKPIQETQQNPGIPVETVQPEMMPKPPENMPEQTKSVQETGNTMEVLDFVRKTEKAGKKKKEIVWDIHQKWPNLTMSEIAKITGYSYQSVFTHIKNLKKGGVSDGSNS